jgi:hypothetical protein
MSQAGERFTGLSANTVRRWETGERWPEPRYRKHLIAIFGRPASDLGLLTSEELSLRPQAEHEVQLRRLWDMMAGDGQGWDRGTVLRAMLGVGVLPLISSITADDIAHRIDESDPSSYSEIARCQQHLYWTAPSRMLFESSYTHTQLGIALVRGATEPARARFASSLAESALLTARLAFFDLGQPAVAARCYDVALAATQEAGDHALAAAVLGHMAFGPAFANDAQHARALVDAALQHAWHGVSPSVRAWLHCVASEVEGRAARGTAARHHIDLATTAFVDDQPLPGWFDFFDAVRLNSFAGYAAIVSGDNQDAAHYLERSLDGLTGPRAAKQRSVVLADLATVHAADGDRAADLLGRAIDALEQEPYRSGLDRVRIARAQLNDSALTADLDQRIAALAAPSGPNRKQVRP